MKKNLLLFFLFPVLLMQAQAWKTYPYQEAGSVLLFPDDEGHHPAEPIEWWYTNARLTGQETGTEYSFMLTYFYFPAFGFDGFRIFNIANEDTGQFYDETQPARYPVLAESHLEIQAQLGITGSTTESWVTKEDSGGNLIPFEYHLSANGAQGALELDYRTVKRPLMVGGTGFLYQGADDYTYYYSQTAVEVSGTFTFEGFTEPVTGTAWIDRQYGTFDPNTGEKYEWFSLQLSNGMDINLWNIFTDGREIPDTSTYRFLSAYIDEDGALTTSSFELERLAYAWTPDGQACYAQQWRLFTEILGMDLLITARHTDHEVALPFRFYEGTTTIEGTVGGQPVTGQGFAELLHHYEHPQLAIQYPTDEPQLDLSQPIRWQLLNPDDGRPVRYRLSVSLDDKESWDPLAQGLTDTAYLWNAEGWPADSLYWLRIEGYSADGTLMGTLESDRSYALLLTSSTPSPSEAALARIFPNPASERVSIQLNPTFGQAEVRLYDAAGRLLRKASGRQLVEWQLAGLPAGTYTIEISNKGRRQLERLVVVD